MKMSRFVSDSSPIHTPLSRRTLFWAAVASGLAPRVSGMAAAQTAPVPAFSYPMGFPGQPLGDGLLVRHGYTCENTWFFPGWWHTGENWYRAGGITPSGFSGRRAGTPAQAR